MYIHIVENLKASQSKIKYIHHTDMTHVGLLVCVFLGSYTHIHTHIYPKAGL